jgi:hypothetical protein
MRKLWKYAQSQKQVVYSLAAAKMDNSAACGNAEIGWHRFRRISGPPTEAAFVTTIVHSPA